MAWLPRKGDRVVLATNPGMAPFVLVRRLGRYGQDDCNELWEALSPRGRRCQVAVGMFWVKWEGRR